MGIGWRWLYPGIAKPNSTIGRACHVAATADHCWSRCSLDLLSQVEIIQLALFMTWSDGSCCLQPSFASKYFLEEEFRIAAVDVPLCRSPKEHPEAAAWSSATSNVKPTSFRACPKCLSALSVQCHSLEKINTKGIRKGTSVDVRTISG
jgi:hypothetical protein